jgi:hypothetical protein
VGGIGGERAANASVAMRWQFAEISPLGEANEPPGGVIFSVIFNGLAEGMGFEPTIRLLTV